MGLKETERQYLVKFRLEKAKETFAEVPVRITNISSFIVFQLIKI